MSLSSPYMCAHVYICTYIITELGNKRGPPEPSLKMEFKSVSDGFPGFPVVQELAHTLPVPIMIIG